SAILPLIYSHHTPFTKCYTLSYTTLFRSPNCEGVLQPVIKAMAQATIQGRADRSDLMAKKFNEVENDFAKRENVCAMHAKEPPRDRKSTRLNSSHGSISYAVFCLKKKKKP